MYSYQTHAQEKDYAPQIAAFYKRRRRMPSYEELRALCGFQSRSAAYKLGHKLIAQGIVQRDVSGKLIPGKRFRSVLLLGSVAAGFPSPAEEELLDTMDLTEFLVTNQEATYMVKVEGDSMIEAGIMPGDMVLVERTHEAQPGDIVIAEIDNGYTMKYLRKRGRRIFLEAANKKYAPIYPQEQLKIEAVVTAVIRKYRCNR